MSFLKRINDRFSIEESRALLHGIFPHYPDLRGATPAPDLEFFLAAFRRARRESDHLAGTIRGKV